MREPVRYVEVDVDVCSLTYGQAPCIAGLGVTGHRKCYNMYEHCQNRANFQRETKTLRFIENLANIPIGFEAFPCLRSISARYSTVNIGGTDRNLSPFGRRANISVDLVDFEYNDSALDPYRDERISGAAQSDGIGYDPGSRGTFFTRLRSRWPFYTGRNLRIVDASIEGGQIVDPQTRHFVISDWNINDDGAVRIVAKDILHLLDNDRAVVPQNTTGKLSADISAAATTLVLTPIGSGAQYPAQGYVSVGSELMAFSRAGDTMTVFRAQSGTTAGSHSQGDTVQLSFSPRNQRVDSVIYDLLVNQAVDPQTGHSGIPASYIDLPAWSSEVTRWAPTLLLDADIIRPTRVSDLLAELAVIGISLWPDEVAEKIGLKMIRPPDGETVHEVTDAANIKSVSAEDQDKNRITEVSLYYDAISADRNPSERTGYSREQYIIDQDAKDANAFGDTIQKQISFRWLNNGDDTTARIAALRILSRLSRSPRLFTITLDYKDRDIGLTDVIRVTTSVNTDETGEPRSVLLQVVGIRPIESGHSFEVTAQLYEYDGRFGFITENDFPTYGLATEAQREGGSFISDNSGSFPDLTEAYEII